LTPAQLDRACGALPGTAVGDALGAPYEFGLAKLGPKGPRMIGGGIEPIVPDEWTAEWRRVCTTTQARRGSGSPSSLTWSPTRPWHLRLAARRPHPVRRDLLACPPGRGDRPWWDENTGVATTTAGASVNIELSLDAAVTEVNTGIAQLAGA
ncbi:MAG: hypothetical protein ACRDQA_28310, partial [Nocardioidaceae bacterium]